MTAGEAVTTSVTSTAEAIKNSWVDRSFKREMASILLMFWGVITVKLFFWSTETMVTALIGAYGTASTLVGMFAMAAFGFDAYIKQLKPGGQG